MEKLDPNQFENVLKDVRSSYRLLALYQRRILDIVKYIGNQYNMSFQSGWSKFSNPISHGKRASIDKWSWDWLTMYLYEFNMGNIKIGDDTYYFKIMHQADTGFFDSRKNVKISRLDVDEFHDLKSSKTRFIFIMSKNEDGFPISNILESHLSGDDNVKIQNGAWMAVPYNMERFINQESTDNVLKDFNNSFEATFCITLINKKE